MILDFKNVTCIASPILGFLTNLHKIVVTQNNGDLILCSYDKEILDIFGISRLDRILKFTDNLDTAIQIINS